MLSKLIKHEFKQTGKVMLPAYGAMTAASLLTILYAAIAKVGTGMEMQINDNSIMYQTVDVIFAILMAITMLGIFAVIFGTVIYGIVRFEKNLMGTQGYFMFSLPVTAFQHIAAKLCTAVVWSVCSIVLGVILVPATILSIDKNAFYFIKQMLRVMSDLDGRAWLLVFLVFIGTVMGMAVTMSLCYAALAMGAHITQNRVIGSFIAFVGLDIATQIVTILVMAVTGNIIFKTSDAVYSIMNSMNANPASAMCAVFGGAIVYLLVLGGIYTAITNYFLSKKLNLA